MDEEDLKNVFKIGLSILVIAVIIFSQIKYNSTTHSDDITMAEWVSPDGVHYWYQQSGYHAMLAPRYDVSGNLVIENK